MMDVMGRRDRTELVEGLNRLVLVVNGVMRLRCLELLLLGE